MSLGLKNSILVGYGPGSVTGTAHSLGKPPVPATAPVPPAPPVTPPAPPLPPTTPPEPPPPVLVPPLAVPPLAMLPPLPALPAPPDESVCPPQPIAANETKRPNPIHRSMRRARATGVPREFFERNATDRVAHW